MPQVAEVALNVQPFQHDARAAARASNPNRRRKWLIPLVLAAQVGGAGGWASCGAAACACAGALGRFAAPGEGYKPRASTVGHGPLPALPLVARPSAAARAR